MQVEQGGCTRTRDTYNIHIHTYTIRSTRVPHTLNTCDLNIKNPPKNKNKNNKKKERGNKENKKNKPKRTTPVHPFYKKHHIKKRDLRTRKKKKKTYHPSASGLRAPGPTTTADRPRSATASSCIWSSSPKTSKSVDFFTRENERAGGGEAMRKRWPEGPL